MAWVVVGDGKFGKYEIGQETESNLDASSYWANRGYNLLPLYTTPPQRKPLSNELINKIVDENTEDDQGYDIWCNGVGVARAIEAAHGIKE